MKMECTLCHTRAERDIPDDPAQELPCPGTGCPGRMTAARPTSHEEYALQIVEDMATVEGMAGDHPYAQEAFERILGSIHQVADAADETETLALLRMVAYRAGHVE